MAFRANSQWRSMLTRMGQNRLFASGTGAKFAPMTHRAQPARYNKFAVTGDFAPVYVVAGMVTIAVAIGIHSLKQQLLHSPGVNLTKKRRESIPEVEDPDTVVGNADKFINNSFLRKVGHIQENIRTLPDPSRPDPFTRPREAETLKTARINPRHH